LKLGMGLGLRISLLSALLLAAASLFATGRWSGLSAGSKAGSGVVLGVLALAALYRDEYELERQASTLTERRGWGPLARARTQALSELRAIELGTHGVRRPGFGEERRASVSLNVGGRSVLLERSIPEPKALALATALKAFLGDPFEIRSK